MTYPPNTELVALWWLKGIPTINPAMVSTTLPRDNSTWAASGFVQVGPASGGGPALHNPLNEPIVSIHVWACSSPNSTKVPWGKAANLGQLIVDHCQRQTHLVPRQPALPAQYQPAAVRTAYPLQDPRRVPGDQGGYAHYQFDLAVKWVAL